MLLEPMLGSHNSWAGSMEKFKATDVRSLAYHLPIAIFPKHFSTNTAVKIGDERRRRVIAMADHDIIKFIRRKRFWEKYMQWERYYMESLGLVYVIFFMG